MKQFNKLQSIFRTMLRRCLKFMIANSPLGILAVGACLSSKVFCQSFIFPGASPSFESGLSQTNTRGAVATMNNPANIVITKKIEVYGDISMLNVDYKYSRSSYAPVDTKVSAPPVNFGVAYKPNSKLALGLFVTPRPAQSAQVIKNVPQDLSGAVILVDIESKSGAFISGLGLGLKLNPMIAVGFSVIETAEDSQLIVRRAGTTDDANALVGMHYTGSFLQYMVGFRTVVANALTIAGSYRTPVAKKYSGTIILEGDQSNTVAKTSYSPGVIALGAEFRFGAPALFAEIRQEAWSAGRNNYSSGLTGSSSTTALNDIMIIIGGGRMRFRGGHAVSLSMGSYPHNVGLGTTLADAQNSTGVNGVQFGDFDGLDRTIVAGSYRLSRKSFDLTAGLNSLTGSRTVPDGYPGAGSYTLSVTTVGVGFSKFF